MGWCAVIAPSAFQLAVVAGALIGAGVALLTWRLVPAQPDLRDALERLSPQHSPRTDSAPATVGDATERLGQWGMRVLPPAVWGRTPTRELAILRIPVTRFYGQKITYSLLGTAIPALLTMLFNAFGASLPFSIPAGAGLVLGGVLFLLPDYNARDDAKRARAEFARALGAYIDLVALERHNGSGPRQAMEAAAAVGDSWVFRRLSEELARTRWSGLTPWESLRALGDELGLSELADLADIMRLSGEEGAQVYASLRARSTAMRNAMLTAEKAKANEVAERMSIPMSLLGVIFLAFLLTPALLRVMGGTT
jgi:Flp pilus assembly protein TadB